MQRKQQALKAKDRQAAEHLQQVEEARRAAEAARADERALRMREAWATQERAEQEAQRRIMYFQVRGEDLQRTASGPSQAALLMQLTGSEGAAVHHVLIGGAPARGAELGYSPDCGFLLTTVQGVCERRAVAAVQAVVLVRVTDL